RAGAAAVAMAVTTTRTTVPRVNSFEMNALPPSASAAAFTICGTMTAVRMPTEIREKTLLGSWLATVKASAASEIAPITPTRTIVRTRPVMRETSVPAPMMALARPRLVTRGVLDLLFLLRLLDRGRGIPATLAHRADSTEDEQQCDQTAEDPEPESLPLRAHGDERRLAVADPDARRG